MPNNIAITAGSGTTVATDQLASGEHVQLMKLMVGTEDSDVRIGHAEDSAHASGDGGVMALGVRNENGVTLPGAELDYSPVATNRVGDMLVEFRAGSFPADAMTTSPATPTMTDGTPRQLVVSPYQYNGASYDRPRNNVEGTALASAARTTSTQSADLTNYNGRGVRVWLDVTAITATPSITLAIEGKDPASGKYKTMLTGAAVTTVSTNEYVVYPGVTETANVDASTPLPRTWRVNVTHGDADSITYSVGYCLIL